MALAKRSALICWRRAPTAGSASSWRPCFPRARCPAGDRAAMADKLAEGLRPGGGPLGAPGLNRDFTLDRMLERPLDVYRELVASPR